MSATEKNSAEDNVSASQVAYVNFRVRCEALSHGEEVYLIAKEDLTMQKVSVLNL